MIQMKWSRRKHSLLVKHRRLPLGNFALILDDSINHCILEEYTAPLRAWEQWEVEIVYGIFRMQLKEMLE
jgi:hypothetical protein